MDRYQVLKNPRNLGTRHDRQRAINQHHQKNQRVLLLEQQRLASTAASTTKKILKPQPAEPTKKSRLEMLQEWKLKKEASEKERKQTKKPPFYAGKLVTSATGSPRRLPMVNIDNNLLRRAGVVTRSQAGKNAPKPISRAQPVMTGIKRIVGKKLKGVTGHKFGFKLNGLTVPGSPQITKSTRKRGQIVIGAKETENNTDALPKKKKTAKTQPNLGAEVKEENFADLGVAKIIYSPCLPTPALKFTHLEYSPNISTGRGNKRMSSSNRNSRSLKFNVDEEIKKEENVRNARIHEFRLFLSNETKRLMDLASKWEAYVEENPMMPEEAIGDAKAVVGKSKLLTSDKFKQFDDLITKCEGGDPKIKVDDLQGFHDWVSLEVEDLDKVYMNLDERNKLNWIAVKAVETTEPVKKKVTVAKTKKPAAKPAGRSALMAHIQAQRKMIQQNQNENVEISDVLEVKKPTPTVEPFSPRSCSESSAAEPVISPRHVLCMSTPVPPHRTSTPRDNKSLRVQLLRQNTGLHVLAATALARLSLSPLSPHSHNAWPAPVNDTAAALKTPQRSILKKSRISSAKKSVGFGVDQKYLLPYCSGTSDDSPEVLDLISTPVRRSSRLANRSGMRM